MSTDMVMTVNQANAWLQTNTHDTELLAELGMVAQFKTHAFNMHGLEKSDTHATLTLSDASGITMFFFHGGAGRMGACPLSDLTLETVHGLTTAFFDAVRYVMPILLIRHEFMKVHGKDLPPNTLNSVLNAYELTTFDENIFWTMHAHGRALGTLSHEKQNMLYAMYEGALLSRNRFNMMNAFLTWHWNVQPARDVHTFALIRTPPHGVIQTTPWSMTVMVDETGVRCTPRCHARTLDKPLPYPQYDDHKLRFHMKDCEADGSYLMTWTDMEAFGSCFNWETYSMSLELTQYPFAMNALVQCKRLSHQKKETFVVEDTFDFNDD